MRLHRLLRNRAVGLTRRALAPLAAWRATRAPVSVPLTSVRRRLELLLAAMYGRPFSIGSTTPRPGAPAAVHDIKLPALMDGRAGVSAATERYRLLAIERAARMMRGTDAESLPSDPLERDLYLIAESASIDRDIAAQAPGLVGVLSTLRRAELGARLPVHRVPPAERE